MQPVAPQTALAFEKKQTFPQPLQCSTDVVMSTHASVSHGVYPGSHTMPHEPPMHAR